MMRPYSNSIAGSGGDALAGLVVRGSQLESVNLAHNRIANEGAKAWEVALRTSTHLQRYVGDACDAGDACGNTGDYADEVYHCYDGGGEDGDVAAAPAAANDYGGFNGDGDKDEDDDAEDDDADADA